MPTTPILPTNYRDIIRLAKKHKMKLTQMACTNNDIAKGKACIIALLGIANGVDYTGLRLLALCHNAKTYEKILKLEAGFEGYGWSYYDNPSLKRYYEIGKRLREYACNQPA